MSQLLNQPVDVTGMPDRWDCAALARAYLYGLIPQQLKSYALLVEEHEQQNEAIGRHGNVHLLIVNVELENTVTAHYYKWFALHDFEKRNAVPTIHYSGIQDVDPIYAKLEKLISKASIKAERQCFVRSEFRPTEYNLFIGEHWAYTRFHWRMAEDKMPPDLVALEPLFKELRNKLVTIGSSVSV